MRLFIDSGFRRNQRHAFEGLCIASCAAGRRAREPMNRPAWRTTRAPRLRTCRRWRRLPPCACRQGRCHRPAACGYRRGGCEPVSAKHRGRCPAKACCACRCRVGGNRIATSANHSAAPAVQAAFVAQLARGGLWLGVADSGCTQHGGNPLGRLTSYRQSYRQTGGNSRVRWVHGGNCGQEKTASVRGFKGVAGCC